MTPTIATNPAPTMPIAKHRFDVGPEFPEDENAD